MSAWSRVVFPLPILPDSPTNDLGLIYKFMFDKTGSRS
jgi:hypothetical protein